jgi:hypothetical protein
MVRENVKIGKRSEGTAIDLGNGNVIMGTIQDVDGHFTGIIFKNSEKIRPVGSTRIVNDIEEGSGIDAIIVFRSIKSIEIFEEMLSYAKDKLTQLNKK